MPGFNKSGDGVVRRQVEEPIYIRPAERSIGGCREPEGRMDFPGFFWMDTEGRGAAVRKETDGMVATANQGRNVCVEQSQPLSCLPGSLVFHPRG